MGWVGLRTDGWASLVTDEKHAVYWHYYYYEHKHFLRFHNGAYWWYLSPDHPNGEYQLGGWAWHNATGWEWSLVGQNWGYFVSNYSGQQISYKSKGGSALYANKDFTELAAHGR